MLHPLLIKPSTSSCCSTQGGGETTTKRNYSSSHSLYSHRVRTSTASGRKTKETTEAGSMTCMRMSLLSTSCSHSGLSWKYSAAALTQITLAPSLCTSSSRSGRYLEQAEDASRGHQFCLTSHCISYTRAHTHTHTHTNTHTQTHTHTHTHTHCSLEESCEAVSDALLPVSQETLGCQLHLPILKVYTHEAIDPTVSAPQPEHTPQLRTYIHWKMATTGTTPTSSCTALAKQALCRSFCNKNEF